MKRKENGIAVYCKKKSKKKSAFTDGKILSLFAKEQKMKAKPFVKWVGGSNQETNNDKCHQ